MSSCIPLLWDGGELGGTGASRPAVRGGRGHEWGALGYRGDVGHEAQTTGAGGAELRDLLVYQQLPELPWHDLNADTI